MKNLKMFAIGLVAFAAMTMGVHAAGVAKVCGESGDYASVDRAFIDGLNSKSGCIELTDNLTASDFTITLGDVAGDQPVNLEIRLNGKTANATAFANTVTINKNSTLTLTGAGSITGAGVLFDVKEGGKLVTSGKVILNGATSNAVIKTAGEVVLGANAEIVASSAAAINIVAPTAKVDMSAKVTGATTIIDYTSYTPNNLSEDVPTVVVNGGEYTASGTAFEVNNKMNLTIKAGKINGYSVVIVKTGNLTVEGGELTASSTDGAAVLVDASATEDSSVTISGGKIVNTLGVAASLGSLDAKYNLGAATYESKANTPALIIAANLLKDLAHQGFITGGDYLYQIAPIGAINEKGATLNTFADMEKVLVKAGLTVTEITKDGKTYRHIEVPKVEDQNTGDGEQTPAPETNPNVPNVPKTNDNILVYASLGVVSALSVGFTAKRKENN